MMEIQFYEVDGTLWFSCQLLNMIARAQVPDEVVSQGKDAVEKYTREHAVDEIVKSTVRREREWEHERQHVDETAEEYPISVEYGSRKLVGVIVPTRAYVTVRLIHPKRYAGMLDSEVNCCAAAWRWNGFVRKEALGNRTVYTKRFTEKANARLIELYRRKRQEESVKRARNLAKQLGASSVVKVE